MVVICVFLDRIHTGVPTILEFTRPRPCSATREARERVLVIGRTRLDPVICTPPCKRRCHTRIYSPRPKLDGIQSDIDKSDMSMEDAPPTRVYLTRLLGLWMYSPHFQGWILQQTSIIISGQILQTLQA